MTEKYGFIDAECATTPGQGEAPTVVQMCGWLGVSRSGFYDWRKRPESETARWRELLKLKIKALFVPGQPGTGLETGQCRDGGLHQSRPKRP